MNEVMLDLRVDGDFLMDVTTLFMARGVKWSSGLEKDAEMQRHTAGQPDTQTVKRLKTAEGEWTRHKISPDEAAPYATAPDRLQIGSSHMSPAEGNVLLLSTAALITAPSHAARQVSRQTRTATTEAQPPQTQHWNHLEQILYFLLHNSSVKRVYMY